MKLRTCLLIPAIFTLLTLALFIVGNQEANATLTTSYVGRPCPGELVTLTCTVSGDFLRWAPSDDEQILISSITPFVSRGPYTAMWISSNATNTTTSTLSTTVQNNVTIKCEGLISGSIESESILVADTPSPPQNVRHTVLSSTTDEATMSIEWDPPVDNGGRDELNYTVNISPSTQLSATVVTSSTVTVTADYNVNYTLSIVATSCAGNSNMLAEYSFIVGGCPIPTSPINGALGSVTSKAVGSTVTFQCNNGFIPIGEMTATCLDTLMWNPDPGNFICSPQLTTTSPPPTAPPIVCGLPQSPLNGSLGSHLPTSPLGTTVTFQCDDGLFPNDIMTATCRDMSGRREWDPNPANLVCRFEPVNCVVPCHPANGVILNYHNIVTTEGSIITFQCGPGLSPEEVMTATCTNAGVWSPDPAIVECRNKQELTAPVSTGTAVGITWVVTFIVTIILGFSLGVLVTYCIMRNKRTYKHGEDQSNTTLQQTPSSPQQQTPTAGPVYEEVSTPKEEIELKTNQAYGPLGH